MALHARIVGAGEADDKIDVHAFHAAIRFLSQGLLTRAQIVNEWQLTASDETGLDWLKARYEEATDKAAFIKDLESLMILAESGRFNMDNEAAFQTAVQAIV